MPSAPQAGVAGAEGAGQAAGAGFMAGEAGGGAVLVVADGEVAVGIESARNFELNGISTVDGDGAAQIAAALALDVETDINIVGGAQKVDGGACRCTGRRH